MNYGRTLQPSKVRLALSVCNYLHDEGYDMNCTEIAHTGKKIVISDDVVPIAFADELHIRVKSNLKR